MRRADSPSRRRFLFQFAAGALTFAGVPQWLRATESAAQHGMPKLAPNAASPNFHPDAEIELVCRPASFSILNGPQTRV